MQYTHLWEQLPWWDTFFVLLELLCCLWCVCDVWVCEVWWVGARIARIEVLPQTIRRANGLWDVARKNGYSCGIHYLTFTLQLNHC